MSVYIDRETREDAIVREIDDHAEIARWLVSRGMLEHPRIFEPAPTIGRKGQFVVLTAKRGVWGMEVLNRSELDARFEQPPHPDDEPATV